MSTDLSSTQGLYTGAIQPAIRNETAAIRERLRQMLTAAGFRDRCHPLGLQIPSIVANQDREPQAVEAIVGLLGRTPDLSAHLLARAAQVRSQIRRDLTNGRMLDFGCGDGEVGARFAAFGTRPTVLYDPVDYLSPRVRERLQDGSLTHFTDWDDVVRHRDQHGRFATALALTVLHHCEDPEQELRRLHQVADRVIIIESVVSDLNSYGVQAFVDWFYNRCLHGGAPIPVPGTFRSPQGWRDLFAQIGFQVAVEEDLRIDLKIAPEHHWIFVLDRL